VKNSPLRGLPAVEKVLQAIGATEMPRPTVVAVVRRELGELRRLKTVPDFQTVVSQVQHKLRALGARRIQPVINGTGVLAHTNFGRAPLGRPVIEALSKIGSQYNNLEYGLAEGSRGGRAAYLEHNLTLLCGAEAATVVNNNAAALVLILNLCCSAMPSQGANRKICKPPARNEVIVSRGELIQIGGGFRIPEILEATGARLREVGTTNKTSLADYARAVTAETTLILKVHRSNFFMGGFVESPSTADLAALARKKRVPFAEDLGSGALLATESIEGLEHEPTPSESIRHGVDLVCFSGDKLLGGPQAGIIAGKAKLIAALKREPLFRAMRCDKLILAALEAVVDAYLRLGAPSAQGLSFKNRRDGFAPRDLCAIPMLQMLHRSIDELRERGEKIIAALGGLPLTVALGMGRSQIGGGTLPRSTVESVTLDLTHPVLNPQQVAAQFRQHSIPIVGYVARGKFKLDLRTIFPSQDAGLVGAIRALAGLPGLEN
jgi:L-seryl-tRNA(Ser) seleniumtransferase